MKRIIGLAIVTALALSAASGAAASAAEYKSESTSGTSYGTAVNEGSHVFTAGAKVTCSGATAEGQFSGTSSKTLETTNIAYTGCTVAGQAATVAMNGCNFLFGEPTGTGPTYSVPSVQIKCPEGKQIVIKATTAGCTLSIGSQTVTSASTATNVASSPRTVSVNASVSKITSTSSGGICGAAGTTSTASASGKTLVKAFSDPSHTKQVGGFIE